MQNGKFYFDETESNIDIIAHIPKKEKKKMDTKENPIPMILNCPECGNRHIDLGEFSTEVHHTHACQHCGMVWRPAIVPTIGVQFLPGFKNDPEVQAEIKRLEEENRIKVGDWYACYLGYHKCQRVSGEIIVAHSEEKHLATLSTKITDPAFIPFLEAGVKK